MVIRHFDACQVVRDGASKQEVICLAASRESVMRHLDAAQRARLDIAGMTCEPLAILKAFGHVYQGQAAAERTTCFIDIGAASTKVVIAHGSRMVFTKTIHAAGDHITRERAKRDGSTFADARAARWREAAAHAPAAATPEPVAVTAAAEADPPASGGGLAILDAQINAQERRAAPRAEPAPTLEQESAADTLDCLTDELQLCVRYHQSLFPGRTIEKLVFLGGEARHVATCQRIARALRIGAQLGDPLARLLRVNQAGATRGVDLDQPQPGWAVPVGLCLSEENRP
jgi:Tfp pilus assembly PilM family ATPase